MKGLEKITARIEQDSHAEIEAVLRQADEAAAAVRSQYADEAAAASAKADGEAARVARERLERLESAARMEERSMVLSAKQALIDRAFAQAAQQLLELPQEEYTELLAKLAARSAKTGREEILLNSRDREAVGAKVAAQANQLLAQGAAPELPEEMKSSPAGKLLDKLVTGASALLQGTAMLTLSRETRPMAGGVILRDGNVEVNCAFETLLRLLREEMTAQVAGVLFP